MYLYSGMKDFSSVIVMIGFLGFFLAIILITIAVLYLVGLWKLFQKAGRKGWEAIIPFYNSWVLVEISGLAWWYALLIIFSTIITKGNLDFILSIGSIVATFFLSYNISKKLHKDTGFAILMTIFPFIMIPLIGFSDKYQFDFSVEVSENGPINHGNMYHTSDVSGTKDTVGTNASYDEKNFCPYCGSSIDGDVNYCGNCGKKIK